MISIFASLVTITITTVAALTGWSASSEPLLRQVSVALTGTENAGLREVDRSACVYRLDGEVFHLRAVAPDAITMRLVERPTLFGPVERVVVTLEGDDTIYEQHDVSFADPLPGETPATAGRAPSLGDAPTYHNASMGAAVAARRVSSKVLTLTLGTGERERVREAWDYVRQNGCLAPRRTAGRGTSRSDG